MDDLVHEALKDIEALKDKKDGLTGVASGFTDLGPDDLGLAKIRPGNYSCPPRDG
jgi:replicative DNA helicase